VPAVELTESDEVVGIPGVEVGRPLERLLGQLLPAMVGVAKVGLSQQEVVPRHGIALLDGLGAELDAVVVVALLEVLPGLQIEIFARRSFSSSLVCISVLVSSLRMAMVPKSGAAPGTAASPSREAWPPGIAAS